MSPAPNESLQHRDIVARVADTTMRWPFRMWGFGEGIALRGLLAAFRVTGNESYREFVLSLLQNYVEKSVGTRNEEHIAPGTELLLMYEECGDDRFVDAARKLGALNKSFPANSFGAKMHRPDMAGWRSQIWVDCMDVDAPFLVRLGKLVGDDSYTNQGLDEILGYARALQIDGQSNEEGLFWHGYESSCGTNGQLWARGNGWALMGLVETLKLLPESSADRSELTDRLNQLCHGLKRHQHTGGLWHTVLDRPDTYLESTLAVMVAFALREAFEHALVDTDAYSEMERKARVAALGCVCTDGGLDRVSDATPIGELEMYASRPFGIFPWGQGPLLLMLSQE